MAELPPFDFNATISPSEAWHDKIEWVMTPAYLMEDEDPQAFLYHLSCPDGLTRSQESSPAFGWLFGPSAGIRAGYSRSTRKSAFHWNNTRFTKPLLSGKVNLRNRQGTRHVEFNLQVNPSRLVHHHPIRDNTRAEDWRHLYTLSATNPPKQFDGEFSLDGKDNWIPQSSAYRPNWRRPWSAGEQCLRIIHEAIAAEVRRACEHSSTDARFIADGRHSIRILETYWEFQHDDPTRLVSSLKPHLMKYSRKGFKTRHYQKRAATGEILDRNCLSIVVPLARGETLAVYAKTNQRVRFEIRQEFHLNAKCLGGSHTAANLDQLKELLTQARRHCAEQMNSIFPYLKSNATMDPEAASTAAFLCHLATALRNSKHFSNVLSILLTNGKLERVPGLEAEIRALRHAGIIEINGPRQNGSYAVSSKYRNALTKLQRKGLASEFGTRNR